MTVREDLFVGGHCYEGDNPIAYLRDSYYACGIDRGHGASG